MGQQSIETKIGKNLRENQAGLVEIAIQHTWQFKMSDGTCKTLKKDRKTTKNCKIPARTDICTAIKRKRHCQTGSRRL